MKTEQLLQTIGIITVQLEELKQKLADEKESSTYWWKKYKELEDKYEPKDIINEQD